ncbi:MAG: hypothetical protein FWE08_01090 [Oscillospiraceae bacterium]|nr:hypothetical protein [Oscillospiraceae bacterium]
MQRGTKAKQIVARFDEHAYAKISHYAANEHRGLGEFVRHAVLVYIEDLEREKKLPSEKGDVLQ